VAAQTLTLFETMGFAQKFEDMTVMGEPVQQCAEEAVVLKDLAFKRFRSR